MEVENGTTTEGTSEMRGHAMEELFREHRTAMAFICITSLILGLPLSINMLSQLKVGWRFHGPVSWTIWNWIWKNFAAFQVATNARGRGVLRLILQQQQMNLMLVPVKIFVIILLVLPAWEAPQALCIGFDILLRFALIVRYIFGFTIALGRYRNFNLLC